MQINFENINNSTVLLRADLNESLDQNGNILGTARLDASISTIQEFLARKNKVVVISHHSDENQSLAPIANYIKKSFADLLFIQSLDIQEIKDKVQNANTNLVLLENLRMFGGEEKFEESNDDDFAKSLASLAEYFVYDAFSVAHRSHASVVSISKYLTHTLGPIAKREEENLSKLYNSTKDMLVIMGGAKLSTKLPIITHFLNSGARVFLGGAMAHPILKKRGLDIKDSLTEDVALGDDIINHKNLLLPIDYIWENKDGIGRILDAGEETMKNIGLEINKAENIMWNGPIGMYEIDGFQFGTKELLTKLDSLDKFVVTGGGDTLSAIENLMPMFKCSYKSLSGGAMLEYLAKGTLPGLETNK